MKLNTELARLEEQLNSFVSDKRYEDGDSFFRKIKLQGAESLAPLGKKLREEAEKAKQDKGPAWT